MTLILIIKKDAEFKNLIYIWFLKIELNQHRGKGISKVFCLTVIFEKLTIADEKLSLEVQ
jgi:hypothetical protein